MPNIDESRSARTGAPAAGSDFASTCKPRFTAAVIFNGAGGP